MFGSSETLAILIHGFNIADGGRATVGMLRPFFVSAGVPYVMVNYGLFGPLQVRLRNRQVAHKVYDAVISARIKRFKRVIVVSHSNGCAISWYAGQYGAPIDKAVFINPALDKDALIPDSIGAVDVWHSPGDWQTRLSRFLPFHPWGDMGAVGYSGDDPRVTNYNKETEFDVSSSRHSDVFSVERLPYFGPLIVEHALQEAGIGP